MNSESTPEWQKACKIKPERSKRNVMTSTVIRFLCHAFGDGPAHDDSLHVSTGFRYGSFSRHAWRLEKPPSAHALLAHFYAGHSSRTQLFTGDGAGGVI